MNTTGWKSVGCGLALFVTAGGAWSEDIVFFDAGKSQPADWQSSGMTVQRMGAMLLFTENDPATAGGSVWVSTPLPYARDAAIDFKLNGLTGGGITLQALFLDAGGATIRAADLAQLKGMGHQKIEALPEAPDGTVAVRLNLVVAGQDGAKVQLGGLSYAYPLHGRKTLVDEDDIKGERWQIESLDKKSGSGPKRYGLRDGQTTGSILLVPQIPWSANNGTKLLVHLPVVEKGTVTVQVQPLDDGNQALPAIDGLERVSAGWHILDLGALKLDEQTTKIVLKFWLGGQPDAQFALDRLVVIAP